MIWRPPFRMAVFDERPAFWYSAPRHTAYGPKSLSRFLPGSPDPMDIEAAKSDILATEDLLERALKLSGLVTTLFAEQGYRLIVVGGSAVEFYTEGGYMSGDIDFCRYLSRAIPLRLAQDVMARLGAKGGPRSWRVLGLFVDLLGYLENESTSPKRKLETPYGPIEIIPPELALVERVLGAYYPTPSEEAAVVAKKMMATSLADPTFDWAEAERLADLRDFKILPEFQAMKKEVQDGSA